MFHALTTLPNAFRPPAVCGPFAVKGQGSAAPTNLSPSQDFQTGWSPQNTTTTTGRPDPDGGNSAVDFQSSATAAAARGINPAANAVASGSFSFSVSVKAGEATWARLQGGVAGNWNVYFDIVNGTVGTSAGTVTGAFISPLGGGWWRIGCSATSGGTVGTAPRVAGAQADLNATFAGNLGVAYLTAYNPTWTVP